MNLLYYIIITLFGLSVGSFLNVVILRFDQFESILKTRSHCPHCKKNLPWYDLVPFFSYFILAGKCRACKKTISIQYPIVEALTAALFILIYTKFGISIGSLFLVFIFSTLIVIATYDWLHMEIPDICTYFAIALSIGYLIYNLWQIQELTNIAYWLPYAWGLVIGIGFFGLLVVVSREKWMGAGDVLLGAFAGTFLGYPNIIVGLFLAFVFGALFSIVLMILKKKKMKDAVAFGPFLLLATTVAFFWGTRILDTYLLGFGF